MRLVAEAGVDAGTVDGILAMGPNLDLDTCFFSARAAEIPDDRPDGVFRVVKNLVAGADTADAWLRMNPYLSSVIRKFQDDVEALRAHGRDITAPFSQSGNRAVAEWYRAVKARAIPVRLVFSSDEAEQIPLKKLLMKHVKEGILGPQFDDADLVTEPDSDHFSLMDPAVIERHLRSVLERLEASGSGAPT